MPTELQETKKDKLNPRQERFCQLFATEKEFFGNGVQSYIEVYNIDTSKKDWYKTACAAASQILSNIKVSNRISDLLEEQGLNDNFVDKQLKFVLTQYADLGNKLGAIREYNKLKGRIKEGVTVNNTFSLSGLFNITNEQTRHRTLSKDANLPNFLRGEDVEPNTSTDKD